MTRCYYTTDGAMKYNKVKINVHAEQKIITRNNEIRKIESLEDKGRRDTILR